MLNKYATLLKDDYRIPQVWFQLENKGMIYDSQGRWRVPEREESDVPQSCVGTFDSDEEN